jgi:hypothetical protein
MVLAGREQATVETLSALIARHIGQILRYDTSLASLESLAAQIGPVRLLNAIHDAGAPDGWKGL